MDSTIAGQGILIVNGLLARTIESIGWESITLLTKTNHISNRFNIN
jgi:hypothetical protein